MMTRLLILLIVGLVPLSCASARSPRQPSVADRIRASTGVDARIEASAAPPGLPPSVDVMDGISSDEAVAVALWNNAAFHVTVSQLGFARADLVEAGLLANPVLSLLFPVGPKQLEATLRWPIEFLWERPKRIAAAQLSLDVAASSLVQAGLDLALSVRVAHADLALALDRQRLAGETAAALQ
jgi:cobalt-zinc-cadmium efflux system outer membrane protein